MTYQDRITDLRRVRAGDLLPAPRNPRRHPARQRELLKGALDQIGLVAAW